MNSFEFDDIPLQKFKKFPPNIGYLRGERSERTETGTNKQKQNHLNYGRNELSERSWSWVFSMICGHTCVRSRHEPQSCIWGVFAPGLNVGPTLDSPLFSRTRCLDGVFLESKLPKCHSRKSLLLNYSKGNRHPLL